MSRGFTYGCPYNPSGVDCDKPPSKERCSVCGWTPEVELIRKEKIKEALKGSVMELCDSCREFFERSFSVTNLSTDRKQVMCDYCRKTKRGGTYMVRECHKGEQEDGDFP